jgi:hypothetical protein
MKIDLAPLASLLLVLAAACGPEPRATAPEPHGAGPAEPGRGPAPIDRKPSGGQPASGRPDGEACTRADECQSGVCEGEGCTTGPKCVAANRMCTEDLVEYCGCDGAVFRASGSCPRRPYKSRGACR